MKLQDALAKSAIARLRIPTKDGNIRYYTTNVHMYAEEYDKQGVLITAYEVFNTANITGNDNWVPVGVML